MCWWLIGVDKKTVFAGFAKVFDLGRGRDGIAAIGPAAQINQFAAFTAKRAIGILIGPSNVLFALRAGVTSHSVC